MIKMYGSIPVQNLSDHFATNVGTSSIILGKDPYQYSLVQLEQGGCYGLHGAFRYCIYVLEAPEGVVLINGLSAVADQYGLGEAIELSISCTAKSAKLLVASQALTDRPSEPIQIRMLASAKRVEKPWGHEIWLTGDPTKVFAFKRILLKAGNKTSLQYHRFKRETNFILSGTAAFHHNPDPAITPEQFSPHSAALVILQGPCVADVYPNLIHRLEAIEDLLLYEVSTPELDDVIRLADDAGRNHGRVAAEHSQNAN